MGSVEGWKWGRFGGNPAVKGWEVYGRREKRGEEVPVDKVTNKDWIGRKWRRGRG